MGASRSSRFETGAASHPGHMRDENEDAFLCHVEAGVWAVADGMGGHERGRLASTTLVHALGSIDKPDSAADLLALCESSIVAVNGQLMAIAAHYGATIGTTIAALLTYDTLYACVWAGDSRVYRIRSGVLTPISRDHTEAQDLVAEGLLTQDEARVWPRRHVITRAIGVVPDPELELEQGTLAPGDLFVLCSDGLTLHVADPEILAAASSCPPQAACDALIALTLKRGGADNVTVIIVRYSAADVLISGLI